MNRYKRIQRISWENLLSLNQNTSWSNGWKRVVLPEKCISIATTGKVLSNIFWDTRGIILIDYLKNWIKVFNEYQAHHLDQLNEKKSWDQTWMVENNFFLHQESAPIHKGNSSMEKFENRQKIQLFRQTWRSLSLI